jgi:hypothetical protein
LRGSQQELRGSQQELRGSQQELRPSQQELREFLFFNLDTIKKEKLSKAFDHIEESF